MLKTQELNQRQVKTLAIAAMLVVAAAEATAGTGGTYMTPLLDFMTTSLEGVVGKVIGVAGIIYGLVAGIKNGSMAGFGVGVGLAIGAYYGPDIVGAMTTGTL
jgi:conjugal transfer pilus assembly protein TraA